MAAPGSRQHDNNPNDVRRGKSAPCVAVAVLNLPVQCTLPQAPALRASFLTALAGDAEIHLDGSAVETVDTAALQVMAAFIHELRQQGRRAQWQQVSAPLHLAARQLGLQQALGLDGGAAAP
jgi:hypothetical protein